MTVLNVAKWQSGNVTRHYFEKLNQLSVENLVVSK